MINRIQEFIRNKEERKSEINEEISSISIRIDSLRAQREKIICSIAIEKVNTSDKTDSGERQRAELKDIDIKIQELKSTIDIKKEIIKNIDNQKLRLEDSRLMDELKSIRQDFNIKQEVGNLNKAIGKIKKDATSICNDIKKLDRISDFATASKESIGEELEEFLDSMFSELACDAINEIEKLPRDIVREVSDKLFGFREHLHDIGKSIKIKRRIR